MRRLIILLLFLSLYSTLHSQDYAVDLNYTVKKNYSGWKQNAQIHLTKVTNSPYIVENQGLKSVNHRFYLYEEGKVDSHEIKPNFFDAMVCDFKTVDDIWAHHIIGSVLTSIQKNGFQTSLRKELEDDAIDFIRRLQYDGRAFKDPYLENYIYSLVSTIAPINLIDGRPGNVNIVILNDDEQNAFIFSNGTMAITTGLLANLHTEDELVAILSHEIAHFVLDHSIANINQEIKRRKRAEFWSAVATSMVAVAEGVAAANNPYYVPGAATLSAAYISTAIANSYLEQQGLNYNHKQESEADSIAVSVLKLLGYDKNSLATALSRIQQKHIEERSTNYYFESYTHPSILSRISSLGRVNLDNKDSNFEKMVSFAVTSVAQAKYTKRRYRQALALIEQNIANNVATPDDYIIRSSCLLALYNSAEANIKAEESILKAKELDPNNINIYKPEIITLLRQNKKEEALLTLGAYREQLIDMNKSLNEIKSDNDWSYWNDYFNSEDSWAKKMIIKLQGM